ncbi:MAG: hypothetical protein HOC63_11795 [Rhodospirillales bacterium]|jgi:hypothetical protein|nr:hypothetical protein [Rhodospirillales bacterium]MBT4627360.1 hypothetical protein [Rhodospirillales bacterium]MBT5350902.1 hypothetical protein [Rhodospirillales bacterium]MBT7147027.1 hypothetical protein [Rhodospirillales bacterium]MBT7779947.1 hypothetical protein [Rhodospirillales bacterium]
MKRLLLALVMVVMVSPAWSGLENGNSLYEACRAGRSIPQLHTLCLGYISGVVDGSRGAGSGVNGWTFCAPETTRLKQAKDIVLAWLEANPAMRQYNASSLIAMALGEAFPCQVSGSVFAAEDTIRDVVAYTGETKSLALIDIGGIGSGFSWTNTILQKRGDEPLYCVTQMRITNDQYFSIFREYVEKNPKMLDEGPSVRGLFLYLALLEAFPCTE